MPPLATDNDEDWAMASELHPEAASIVPGTSQPESAPDTPISTYSSLSQAGGYESENPESEPWESWSPDYVRINWRAGQRVLIDLQHGAASSEMGQETSRVGRKHLTPRRNPQP
jgi:hypothetical protein